MSVDIDLVDCSNIDVEIGMKMTGNAVVAVVLAEKKNAIRLEIRFDGVFFYSVDIVYVHVLFVFV